MRAARLARMARHLAFAFAFAGAGFLFPAAQGCDHVSVSACTTGETRIIQASSFDQSCKVDSDCVAVGEGDVCYPCIVACSNAAINVSAKGQYDSVVSNTAPTNNGDTTNCNCPASFNPCCRDGICHADLECQNLPPATEVDADTGADASADACAPSGCTGSCLGGRHNVSTMVDGCLLWQCCVPDEAGADAATDSGPLDAAGE